MQIVKSAQVDRPRNEPRVRMRVKVKPLSTSLPRAEDEVYTEHGTNLVPHGEHTIVVYLADVPKVLAKVEPNTAEQRGAHRVFWRNAVAAVLETSRNTKVIIPPERLVLPPEDQPTGSCNRWVETYWPDGDDCPAGRYYFNWLTKHCDSDKRSPQAIFVGNVGRAERPLEFAYLVDENGNRIDGQAPTIDAPVPEEQQQTMAMVGLVQKAFGAAAPNGGGDVAALKSENAELRAQVAAMNARFDALLTKMGEPVDAPKTKRQ